MKTEIEKLKDEVFLEAKKRCEEFKAEYNEDFVKFTDELFDFFRNNQLIMEADLYLLKDEVFNLNRNYYREEAKEFLEECTWIIKNSPYHFAKYFR